MMLRTLSVAGLMVLLSGFLSAQAVLDPGELTPSIRKFTFAGDLMAHRPNWATDDYHRVYDKIRRWLQEDDISFINLETPVREDRPYATYPEFNVHRAYVEAALGGGFEVFSLANNHSFDQGSAGIDGTLSVLRELGRASLSRGAWLAYSGLRAKDEVKEAPPRLEIFHAGNLTLGFVSVTEFLNHWRHDGRAYLYDYQREDARRSLLAWIKRQDRKVDILVLGQHAGVEYSRRPTAAFRNWARDLVAAGVDIVWGHHPHVLQDWYTLPGPDGRPRVVMPSLGNFVSGQTWNLGPGDYDLDRAWTGDSALFRVRIRELPGVAGNSTGWNRCS